MNKLVLIIASAATLSLFSLSSLSVYYMLVSNGMDDRTAMVIAMTCFVTWLNAVSR